MSTMNCFATADDAARALPLVLLRRQDLDAFLDTQPACTGAWARAHGWTLRDAAAGEVELVVQ